MDPEARRQLAAEHRELGELVRQLEIMPNPEALRSRLEHLKDILVRHFAHEVAPDGLYGLLHTKAPHLSEAGRELAAEHDVFLVDLNALLVRSVSATTVVEVTAFCARLRRHEKRETSLLTDAFSTGSPGDPS